MTLDVLVHWHLVRCQKGDDGTLGKAVLVPELAEWMAQNDPDHAVIQLYQTRAIVQFGSEAAVFAFKLRWC